MTDIRDSAVPLCERYDVALLDLDGVVYVGTDAVDHAPAALAAARERGMRLAFVTNNAARPPTAVARLLSGLGVPAEPGEVITSAQAAAHHLARELPAGSPVLVVGGAGLVEALEDRGLVPVRSADDGPAAVVQGFSPQTDWAMLVEACVAIRRGVPWLATNLDPTVPSPRGAVLGNGSLVAAVRHATGVVPESTGKPDPRMHRETVERSGARRPLVVGDRLDTDIEGASRVGCDSLLVLTGVTGPADLLAAPPQHRPTHLAADLRGLLAPGLIAERAGEGWRCGQATVRADPDRRVLVVGGPPDGEGPGDGGSDGAGSGDGRPGGAGPGGDVSLLWALCAAAWEVADAAAGPAPQQAGDVTARHDTPGRPDPAPWSIAADGDAGTAVRRLGLDRR